MNEQSDLLAVEAHARKRARDRYGLHLTSTDYLALCRRAGKPGEDRRRALLRGGLARRVLALWQSARWVLVVYDPKLRRIVTFLPQRAFGDYELPPRVRGQAA